MPAARRNASTNALVHLAYPDAVFLLLPAGVAMFIPFGILVGLGQRYLPTRPGLAGGVTLGLSASVGALGAPHPATRPTRPTRPTRRRR